MYVSEHPLDGVRGRAAAQDRLPARRARAPARRGGRDGRRDRRRAQADRRRRRATRWSSSGSTTCPGTVEVVVFNSVLAAARDLLDTDRILVVKGRVDHKQEGETKLIALEVAPFEATPEPDPRTSRLSFSEATYPHDAAFATLQTNAAEVIPLEQGADWRQPLGAGTSTTPTGLRTWLNKDMTPIRCGRPCRTCSSVTRSPPLLPPPARTTTGFRSSSGALRRIANRSSGTRATKRNDLVSFCVQRGVMRHSRAF